MSAIRMERSQRILVGLVVAGAVVIAGIGFAGSYAAVRTLALHKGFGWFAYVFPVGVDAGIVVLLSLDLLLTWLRIPFPLLRQTAWLLTAATVAFNGAAAWPDPLGVGMHAVIPLLFVVAVEAARHAVGRIADLTADRHMESVRIARWLLAFPSTFRLWRRMKLWELRSYDQVIRLEQDRLVYQARLRARFGRAWRRRAPVESLMPLRLAKYGVPLSETGAAGLLAAGIEPEAVAFSAVSTPKALTPGPPESGSQTTAPASAATPTTATAQDAPGADAPPAATPQPLTGVPQAPAPAAVEPAPVAPAPQAAPAVQPQTGHAQVYGPEAPSPATYAVQEGVSYVPREEPDPSQPIPWPLPQPAPPATWPQPAVAQGAVPQEAVAPQDVVRPGADGPQQRGRAKNMQLPPWFTAEGEPVAEGQTGPSPWPAPVQAADAQIPHQQDRRRLAEPPPEPEVPVLPDGMELEGALAGAFNQYTQMHGETPNARQFGYYLADTFDIRGSDGTPLGEQYLRPRLNELIEQKRVEESN